MGNAADGRAEKRDATPGAIPSTSGANAGSIPAGRAGDEIVEHFAANRGLKATRQELARDLGLGINVVCARVNNLLLEDSPLIVERGKKRCAVSGRDVNALELAGIA